MIVFNLGYTKTEIDNELIDKVSVSTFNDAIQSNTSRFKFRNVNKY